MLAFLREPLLDWQREAQLLAKLKGRKIVQGQVEWHEEAHAQLKVIVILYQIRPVSVKHVSEV